jgi:hypothetical protein
LPFKTHSQYAAFEPSRLQVGARLVQEARASRHGENLAEEAIRSTMYPGTEGELGKAVCGNCGAFRRLIFRDGIKCRDQCMCDRRAKRRRLGFKQPDVLGAFEADPASRREVHKRDARGHLLFVFPLEGLTWCNLCGAFTNTHLKDLGKECFGEPCKGKHAALSRLRRGLHPITLHHLAGRAERVVVE